SFTTGVGGTPPLQAAPSGASAAAPPSQSTRRRVIRRRDMADVPLRRPGGLPSPLRRAPDRSYQRGMPSTAAAPAAAPAVRRAGVRRPPVRGSGVRPPAKARPILGYQDARRVGRGLKEAARASWYPRIG